MAAGQRMGGGGRGGGLTLPNWPVHSKEFM